jgi:mannose-6-phosphate isomerase-like protein (cupin superfamily)
VSNARQIPTRIRVADVERIVVLDAAPRTTFARLISHAQFDANLLIGVCTMPPGEDVGWAGNAYPGLDGYGPADYAYYILNGQLAVDWEGQDGDAGRFDLGPEEALYMPAGFKYWARNEGEHTAQFLYCMTPPQFGSKPAAEIVPLVR